MKLTQKEIEDMFEQSSGKISKLMKEICFKINLFSSKELIEIDEKDEDFAFVNNNLNLHLQFITQEEIVQILKELNFDVTQATISRKLNDFMQKSIISANSPKGSDTREGRINKSWSRSKD